ncbi:MAG: hypothetical protein K0R68_1981, partial [Mycobacterium sp.]|nr:hypothetical protein [Mycobacterium sp.]
TVTKVLKEQYSIPKKSLKALAYWQV